MDFESRDLYRNRLSKIAEHCDCAELDVAKGVLKLAEEAQRRSYENPGSRCGNLTSGFYLLE